MEELHATVCATMHRTRRGGTRKAVMDQEAEASSDESAHDVPGSPPKQKKTPEGKKRYGTYEKRCTYEHCPRPDDGRGFMKIEEGRTSGGQDWSSLVGMVLCAACYDRYKSRGTLERMRALATSLTPDDKVCSYEKCDSPVASGNKWTNVVFHIQEGTKAGGRDWSSLVGRTFCAACYNRFRKRGTLEISAKKKLMDAKLPKQKCSNGDCDGIDRTKEFFRIRRGPNGDDAPGDPVVCKTCYHRYQSSGALGRIGAGASEKQPSEEPLKRSCTYKGCDAPDACGQYYKIDATTSLAGQDWSSLEGEVLCKVCFLQFRDRGTLERADPKASGEMRCFFSTCRNPDKSKYFFNIEEGTITGGQDWTPLVGKVLCKSCYNQYTEKGTLVRARNKPLKGKQRRCTYEHCKSPDKSSKFVQVEAAMTTGGQDWSPLAGRVLCISCYQRYRAAGTLDRSGVHHLIGEERRCTHDRCSSPGVSRWFYKIDQGKTTGGQDWRPVAGKVLCFTCYSQYLKYGTLEKISPGADVDAGPRVVEVRKRAKDAEESQGGSVPKRRNKQRACMFPMVEPTVDGVAESALCIMCMEEERQMCIVPCGHHVLCTTCGEAGIRMGEEEKQPFCPVCCKDMRAPWVMDRAAWEKQGGRMATTSLE